MATTGRAASHGLCRPYFSIVSELQLWISLEAGWQLRHIFQGRQAQQEQDMPLGYGGRILCRVRLTAVTLALLQAAPGHAQGVGYLVPAFGKDKRQAGPGYECDIP